MADKDFIVKNTLVVNSTVTANSTTLSVNGAAINSSITTVSGNVGIGTSSPAVALQINQTVPQVRLLATNNSVDMRLVSIGDSSVGVVGTYSANHATVIYANNAESARFAANGNVGIGNTAPAAKLHITGSSANDTMPELRLTGSGGYLDIHNSLNAGSFNSLVAEGDKAIIFTAGSQNTGNLVIAPWHTSGVGVKVTSTGNVGIGVASPNALLAVGGTANVSGNVVIGGTANVVTNLNVGGAVNVTGNTTLSGAANVALNLNVTGTANVGGSINVTGAANIGTNLGVGGVISVTGNTTISGSANVAQNLNVSGLGNITGNTTISGFANVIQNLNVGGTASITGSVNTSGSLNATTGSVNVINVNATGTISGANISSTGTVSAANLFSSAGITGTTITASGTVSGASVSASGTVSGASVTASGTVSGASVSASGTVSGATISSSGSVSDADGDLRNVPPSTKSVAYELVAADSGIGISTTTTVTVNSSVLPVGFVTTIYNNSASTISIVQGTGTTMYLAGTSTTGNRSLLQRGLATVYVVASGTVVITGAGIL